MSRQKQVQTKKTPLCHTIFRFKKSKKKKIIFKKINKNISFAVIKTVRIESNFENKKQEKNLKHVASENSLCLAIVFFEKRAQQKSTGLPI